VVPWKTICTFLDYQPTLPVQIINHCYHSTLQQMQIWHASTNSAPQAEATGMQLQSHLWTRSHESFKLSIHHPLKQQERQNQVTIIPLELVTNAVLRSDQPPAITTDKIVQSMMHDTTTQNLMTAICQGYIFIKEQKDLTETIKGFGIP